MAFPSLLIGDFSNAYIPRIEGSPVKSRIWRHASSIRSALYRFAYFFRLTQDLNLCSKTFPDSFFICKMFHFSYSVAGAVQRSGDLCDVVSKAMEPEDFAIIYHDHRPPKCDSHTNVCHIHYKNDVGCMLSLSEISDLNLREG